MGEASSGEPRIIKTDLAWMMHPLIAAGVPATAASAVHPCTFGSMYCARREAAAFRRACHRFGAKACASRSAGERGNASNMFTFSGQEQASAVPTPQGYHNPGTICTGLSLYCFSSNQQFRRGENVRETKSLPYGARPGILPCL